jgi:hypothetical protein
MNIIKLLLTALTGIFLFACSGGSDSSPTVAAAPTSAKVVAGPTVGTTASVSFTAPASDGGRAITGYTVTANPGGITATGAASPIAVTGLTAGTAYTFSVVATNGVGNSAAVTVNNKNSYKVVETFKEPMTQPKNSIFIGTFTYDSVNQTVSNLNGTLSESMTGTTGYPGDNMTWLTLNNHLSSVPVTLGGVSGLLVTTFLNTDTNPLSPSPTLGGTDGWAPGTGSGMHYGMTTMMMGGANPGNAYAMIFVNTADPTTALTQAQLDRLAYADCAPGGMMMSGKMCMTGTTVAGYGVLGTMDGYPESQVITKQ